MIAIVCHLSKIFLIFVFYFKNNLYFCCEIRGGVFNYQDNSNIVKDSMSTMFLLRRSTLLASFVFPVFGVRIQ